MLWEQIDKFRNYSVIIIPQRGGRTRTIKLSALLLKITVSLLILTFLIIFVLTNIFLRRYSTLSRDASAVRENKKYIKTLEDENREKQKQIDDYKSVESQINDRLKELQKLQDDIKGKLDKSISLNGTSSSKSVSLTAAPAVHTLKHNLVTELDVKIETLNSMDKQLNNLLEKEKYIPSMLPNSGRISSSFGERSNPYDSSSLDYHPGIDIANSYGSKIYASAKGTVTLAGYYSGYGNAVMLNHHNGLETLYGHTSKILVSNGQEVEKGQLIALVGSSGYSTGPHVHFEVRKNGAPVNPMQFIKGGK